MEKTAWLWFAFNLWSLTYLTHLLLLKWQRQPSCDLLSISDLWHTWHTHRCCRWCWWLVVICFQSLIFDILDTLRRWIPVNPWCCDLLSISDLWHTWHTIQGTVVSTSKLWFAFNLWSLTYLTHCSKISAKFSRCCDLLSISDLWHTWHTS